MKKILFIAVLAITAISCDKDKDDTNNTNSIEGRWTIAEQVSTYNTVGFTSIGGDTTVLDSSNVEILPTDSLEGAGIEFLSNGTAYLFDEDGNDDTTSYTYSNSILELVIPEGSENGEDTTFTIPVSNLTSNSADLLFLNYTESYNEIDSSFGIVFETNITISSTVILKVTK
jgi:hypothetical protein